MRDFSRAPTECARPLIRSQDAASHRQSSPRLLSAAASLSKQFTAALQTALALTLDDLALAECTDAADPRPDAGSDANLLDTLFADGFAVIEFVSGVVPCSRHEAFGALAVEAAMLRDVEMEFLARMIDIELATIDPFQRTDFFGGMRSSHGRSVTLPA